MTKEDIYNALNPDWWILNPPNSFGSQFVSTIINFANTSGNQSEYVSSAPYQTDIIPGGAKPSSDPYGSFVPSVEAQAWHGNLDDLIEDLRIKAAQRLFNMHCREVIGASPLPLAYNAES